MKHNWEYKKLGEVGTVITGSTPSTKEEEYYSSNDFMFVKPGDISDGGVSNILETETYISKKAFSSVCRQLPKEAVLTTCIGNIGKVGILTKAATCNQQINAIIPRKLIIPKYLAYSILSIKDLLNSKKNGPVVPIINKTQFSSFYIPCPILKIQEKIVTELDEINGIMEGRKEQLKLLDQLAQSIFYEMFGDPITNPKGWEVKSLKNLTLDKLSYGSGASGIPFDGKVRYIRITDIDDKGLLKEEIASSPSEYDSKYDLKSGDLLLARSGATVGKSFLYDEIIGKAIYAGYLIRVRPNPEIILPLFIYQFTQTQYYRDYIKNSIRGAAQPNVNAQLYGLLKVFIPPISLQNRFASKIKLIEEQKLDIENSIKELETLLASRMDYWFN